MNDSSSTWIIKQLSAALLVVCLGSVSFSVSYADDVQATVENQTSDPKASSASEEEL